MLFQFVRHLLLSNGMKGRILYIATSSVWLKTGGGLANKAILEALELRYPDMIDVIHISDPSVPCPLPSNYYVLPAPTRLGKLLLILKGRIHRYNPWVLDFIDNSDTRYSTCIINGGILGDLVPGLHTRGIKVVMVHHNCEVEFQKDNRNPSALFGLCTFYVRRNEKLAYVKSDMNLFLTQSDMDTFAIRYGTQINGTSHLLGMFENRDRNLATVGDSTLPSDHLVICGSLNSVQTLTGMKDFAAKYLPIVHKVYEEKFSLLITGRSPADFICKLVAKDPNITLVPNPEDISDTIKGCGIFICPTNVGGGIKLRIMDGLRLGMPVLTHKVSARGYECFIGMPWFQVYETEKEFESGLKLIIDEIMKESGTLREDIVKAYYSSFSFISGAERLEQIFNSYEVG